VYLVFTLGKEEWLNLMGVDDMIKILCTISRERYIESLEKENKELKKDNNYLITTIIFMIICFTPITIKALFQLIDLWK